MTRSLSFPLDWLFWQGFRIQIDHFDMVFSIWLSWQGQWRGLPPEPCWDWSLLELGRVGWNSWKYSKVHIILIIFLSDFITCDQELWTLNLICKFVHKAVQMDGKQTNLMINMITMLIKMMMMIDMMMMVNMMTTVSKTGMTMDVTMMVMVEGQAAWTYL